MWAKALLKWYDQNRRKLPWREDPSPYHVWISEIMLQQTRVEAVLDYYRRFLEALPTIESLAMVEEDPLLKLWQGLGYYSRARNLQKTAKILVQDYGGKLPQEEASLKKLPGIGPYTAGAIASIAFGKAVVAVDSNAYRIAARMTREEEVLDRVATKKRLEAFLQENIDPKRPGDFNQAMMDLASSVCTAKNRADCPLCPLKEACQSAFRADRLDFPRKKEKKPRRLEEKTVLFLQKGDWIYLEKRSQGLLLSLWGFPMLSKHYTKEQISQLLFDQGAARVDYWGKSRHVFSHVEWQMEAYRVLFPVEEAFSELAEIYLPDWERQEGFWVSSQAMEEELSVPSAYRFLLEKYAKDEAK